MHRKMYSFICLTLLLSLLISPFSAHATSAAPGRSDPPSSSPDALGPGFILDDPGGSPLETGSHLFQNNLLSEDFSNEVFPPPGWTVYNLDGSEPNWERVTDDYVSGPASASHKFNVPPQPLQVGWLVTPSISLPTYQTVRLSLYEKTQRPQSYFKQEIRISTGACTPTGGDFTFLVEVVGSDVWHQVEVDLSSYAGETVCLAFVYEGHRATRWYIDDVLVTATDYALSLEAEVTAKTGPPGELVEYELTLTNLGSLSGTFDLSHAGAEWEVSLSHVEVTLEAGGSQTITASVEVPLDALASDLDTVFVSAVSQGNSQITGQVELTTTADAVYGLELTASESAQNGLPGGTVVYTLTLANLGNTTDTYNLSYSGAEWEVSLSETQVELEAGESTVLTAQVTVPDGAGDGDADSVLVTAASAGSPGQSANLLLTTTVVLTPLASFEASPVFVKVGKEVTFTNSTTGSLPLTYHWDFGDGTTSAETDPVHVYEEEGEYTVSLTAYNPYGESTFELVISAGYAPTAAFNPSLEAAVVGEKVVFTNASTGSGPLQYSWDFGDGESSSAVNPEHTFTAPGLYTVSLLASNLYGEDEAAFEILVTPAAPVGANLEISLEVFPLPVRVNQATTIKATVFNHGPQTATGVSARGPIPEFIEILAYSPACAVEEGELTCDLGEIEAGESKSAWITVLFTQAGTYEAELGASGLELDPDLENNLAATAILVEMNTLYLPLMQKP